MTDENKIFEQYIDIDDDEESPLGAAIFREIIGMSVEDVLDETDCVTH
jgi:hypothetical protein